MAIWMGRLVFVTTPQKIFPACDHTWLPLLLLLLLFR